MANSLKESLGPVGLGMFPFSNAFTLVDEGRARAIVATFLELGGKYLETAPVYAEPFPLSRLLAEFPRESFVLATKCVSAIAPNGERVRTGAYDAILRQAKEELRRLGVDRLDVLQAHITPEDVDPGETMRALSDLQDEGLVGAIGVSNVTLEQLKAFAAGGRIDLVQNRLSLIHRRHYHAIMSYCRESEILVNPYQVIERGQLAQSPSAPEATREGDLRRRKIEYSGDVYHTIRSWYDGHVQPIARSLGVPAEQLAIAWALQQPQVACCVVGATSVQQLVNNVGGGTLKLSADVLEELELSYLSLVHQVRERYGLSIEEYRGLGG